jgi:hypothetical protein
MNYLLQIGIGRVTGAETAHFRSDARCFQTSR